MTLNVESSEQTGYLGSRFKMGIGFVVILIDYFTLIRSMRPVPHYALFCTNFWGFRVLASIYNQSKNDVKMQKPQKIDAKTRKHAKCVTGLSKVKLLVI